MSRDLTQILKTLGGEERPLRHQLLHNLSDLTEAELKQVEAAAASYSPQRRLKLIQALVQLAEDRVDYDFRPIFVWALDDADPRIRTLAIEGLWEDEHTHLVNRYLQFLDDEDAMVRATAAMALGRFIQLGELGQIPFSYADRAADALWNVYHTPRESVDVRRRALEGLSSSSRAGVRRVIEGARHDKNPSMRASAFYAMGRSADRRWIPYLLPELNEENPALRLEVVRALGELASKAAIDPLILMLDTEHDSEVRMAILEALGQIGGDKAKEALQIAVESEDETEAAMADLALEQLYAGIADLQELIDEVMGITQDEEEEDLSRIWDDFYDDPLEDDIRRLLDDLDVAF